MNKKNIIFEIYYFLIIIFSLKKYDRIRKNKYYEKKVIIDIIDRKRQ